MTYTDSRGRKFVLKVTAGVIDRFCAETGNDFFAELTHGFTRFDLACTLLWLACDAESRNIGRTEFVDGIDLGRWAETFASLMEAVAAAFPGMGDVDAEGGDEAPPARGGEGGASMTSTVSPQEQESSVGSDSPSASSG